MRAYIIFLYMALAVSAHAQSINFEDGFEDGNFSDDPAWEGDTTDFTVIDVQDNHLLQLTGKVDGGVSYLSAPIEKVDGYWDFYLRFDFSSLSGSNHAAIYLMSDRANLAGRPNGYALQAGEAGSDDVLRLFRIEDGNQADEILSGTTNINAGGEYRVRINRSENGDWTLETATGYDGELSQEAAGTDTTFAGASYFGVLLNYTSTRSDKFYFDFKIDLPPLQVIESRPEGRDLWIEFNRPIDAGSLAEAEFILEGVAETPSSANLSAPETIRLTYPDSLPSGNHTLAVSGLQGEQGEELPADYSIDFLAFDAYDSGDIIINEFMYDPPAGIPEYVELKNNSGKLLNLQQWEVGDEAGRAVLSADTLVMQPDSFLVITRDTTALGQLFGTGFFLQSTLPFLNNDEDAITIHNERDEVVDSLFYDSSWGGMAKALERRSANHPSTLQANWADSPHPEGGTPGTPNLAKPDTLPPALSALKVPDADRLILAFSEEITAASGSETALYSLSEDISVTNARALAPDTVEITVEPSLQNTLEYVLEVNGVEDLFGNAAELLDTSFVWYEVSEADSGDVLVNEFLYDPPEGVPEYIELYNPTNRSFNLRDWTLNDNTGTLQTLSSEDRILPPGGYLVLTPDSTIADHFKEVELIPMQSRFPALNNYGDDIVIRNEEGTPVDSVRYTADWGGISVALERLDTGVASSVAANWGESPETIGTPGRENAVPADTEPPELSGVEVSGKSGLKLTFSEPLDTKSAERKNFSLDPPVAMQMAALQQDTVHLFLAEELISGQTYELGIDRISDLFGNSLTSLRESFEYLKYSRAQPGDIVINEFLPIPGENNRFEFIELYNRSSKNIDLEGWIIADAIGPSSPIGRSLTLRPGEFAVFTGSESFATGSRQVHYLPGFPSLNNRSDAIALHDAERMVMDSLFYREEWGSPGNGRSFEREDPAAASNDSSNWVINHSEEAASPGFQNSGYQPDEEPPAPVFSTVLDDRHIELRFNEFIKPDDELEITAGGTPLEIETFRESNADKMVLKHPAGILGSGDTHQIFIQNLRDVRGNRAASTSIPVTFKPVSGDLVINEILYNPINNNEDGLPDQTEYVEIHNNRSHAVSLEGIYLHDAPDEDGEVRSVKPVSSDSRWIPPNSTALFYADTQTGFQQSSNAVYFELNELDPGLTLRADRSSLSLAAADDAVFLSDSTDTVIDSVFYDESWHNPNRTDTRGIALERIDPAGASNDRSNWGSSTHPKGGTPGSENSIFQEAGSPPDETGIAFSPNPFSPDDDGREDRLFINYKLDEPDYMLRVRIFDRYGRFIRNLADGKPAGFEGSLTWDGLTEEGRKNRIGIYIVLFEAYNSADGRRRVFKEIVVLARQM